MIKKILVGYDKKKSKFFQRKKFYLGWVRAEVSMFIKTLDTIACVSFLTLTLVQPSVGKLSVHLALRVGVTRVGDVTTITDHRVAVLGVLA